MFCCVCISILMLCMCISVFNVAYKFKIRRPKYLFLWCFFFNYKRVQKGVYRNDGVFLLWDRIKLSQTYRFYTANVAIVLILSPCNSTGNVVTFFDSSNKFSWELCSICCQYLSNISASQIEEYLGFGGLKW